MRISSNFRDYYDNQQKHYTGKSVWTRRCNESTAKEHDLPANNFEYSEKNKSFCLIDSGWTNRYIRFSPFVIGFCGKVYKGFCRHNNGQYHYSFDDMMHGLEIAPRNKFLSSMSGKKLDQIKRFFETDIPFRYYNAAIYVQKYTQRYDSEVKLYVYGETGDYKLTLESMQFNRIIPPHTAYMELEMYLNGVMGFANPYVPEMDNATKIAQHGFDRFSFRKPKND